MTEKNFDAWMDDLVADGGVTVADVVWKMTPDQAARAGWDAAMSNVEAMKRIAGDGAQQAEPVAYANAHHLGERMLSIPARREPDQYFTIPLFRAAPAPSASPAALADDRKELAAAFGMLPNRNLTVYGAFCEGWKARALLAASPADQGEDARRLEWLIRNEVQVWEVNRRYSIHEVTEHHAITGEFMTARDAIDAAMSASKEGGAHQGCPYPASCDAIQQCYGGCKRPTDKEDA